MDNSTHDMSEKLLQYLDGELPGEEKDELEKQLATDQELQSRLESLKLSREAVRQYGLRQNVARMHGEMMSEKEGMRKKMGQTRRIIRYSIAVAASIFVVFLATIVFKSSPASPEQLFADNYHSYELSATRDADPVETKIEKAYKNKDFNQVIQSGDTSTSLKPVFLIAMSYMELQNDSAAIEKFRFVINANDSAHTNRFKDEAEYYLALAYLRHREYQHALEVMERIRSSSTHLYRERITDKLIRNVRKLN